MSEETKSAPPVFDLRSMCEGLYEQALESQKQQDNAAYQSATEETRIAFAEWFGVPPDRVEGRFAYSGDVCLHYAPPSYTYDYGHSLAGWHVVGKCPKCSQEGLSPWCGNAQSIGEYTKNFRLDWDHSCKVPEPEAPVVMVVRAGSPAAFLLQAIDTYVRSVIQDQTQQE